MDSEPKHSKVIQRMVIDNYSIFYVIKEDSASDIEKQMKASMIK